MADSAGTDTHRMWHTYVPHVLRRALDPLSPTPFLLPAAPPSYPSDVPLTIPPPSFLRMHVLAETANEDSSFL